MARAERYRLNMVSTRHSARTSGSNDCPTIEYSARTAGSNDCPTIEYNSRFGRTVAQSSWIDRCTCTRSISSYTLLDGGEERLASSTNDAVMSVWRATAPSTIEVRSVPS
jgi:hypothetical protein